MEITAEIIIIPNGLVEYNSTKKVEHKANHITCFEFIKIKIIKIIKIIFSEEKGVGNKKIELICKINKKKELNIILKIVIIYLYIYLIYFCNNRNFANIIYINYRLNHSTPKRLVWFLFN